MTRQEQINKACDNEVVRILCEDDDRDLYEEEVTLGAVFRKGARWADENPCWRYIGEDDLPSEATNVFAVMTEKKGSCAWYIQELAFYPKGHQAMKHNGCATVVTNEDGEWVNAIGYVEDSEDVLAWMPRPQFDFEKSRKLLGQ